MVLGKLSYVHLISMASLTCMARSDKSTDFSNTVAISVNQPLYPGPSGEVAVYSRTRRKADCVGVLLID